MADELLRDNLNDSQPLPHGVHSGYYRFCQHNGLVLSVGVPLGPYMTLVHVAEDVRDQDWPVPNFWRQRPCVIRIHGDDNRFVVRERRPEYGMFCLCMRKVVRDLKTAGILHETAADGARVDWARSGEVFDFFMSRNRQSSYPYFLTALVLTRDRSTSLKQECGKN
jgi:aminoglycoside 3-N-acetyltransferase